MIRIGYVPHSKNLLHPGDRRRLVSFANEKKMLLNTVNPLESDILVLSNAANFGYWMKKAKQPVILDLVDGYIGENPNIIKDILRNVVRSMHKTSDLRWLTYTRHLRYACKMSDAVIVASREQQMEVSSLNKNVHIVLDSHQEIDEAVARRLNSNSIVHASRPEANIFWEGFGFTLKHFGFISRELDQFLANSNWGMYLLTVEEFPRWGGYIGKVKTAKLIKKLFPLSWKSIQVIPWSLDNLATFAAKSKFGIIPINPSDKFARLKSENKLLSMWHLNLPVIFSDSPSYSRVAHEAGVESAVIGNGSWGEALKHFSDSPSELAELRDKGLDYVTRVHTKDILTGDWEHVLRIFSD